MSREARERYLTFARSTEVRWSGNFREFAASLRRVATRATTNDADRRRKHLAKHGLTLQAIQTG